MTNNKQQTAIDLFAEKTFNLIELMKSRYVNQEEFLDGMLKARNEAKEMEKEQIILSIAKNLPIEDGVLTAVQKAEQYYEKTYGNDKQ